MSLDSLHRPSHPGSTWTTTNAAEAMPGVMKPLGWSVFGPAVEGAVRWALRDMGVLTGNEAAVPIRPEDWQVSAFYGRFAIRVDFWSTVGDRLPGTSGTAVAQQWLGFLPEGFLSQPTRRFYPILGIKAPRAIWRAPRRVRQARRDTEVWWRQELAVIREIDDIEAARSHFVGAADRFAVNMRYQTLSVLLIVQPIFDRLARLATKFDAGSALMAGYGGHEETQVVDDLWACSRGALDLDTFLDRHGYHGPSEGDISATVWRENPEPLLRLLNGYRAMPDDTTPVDSGVKRAQERQRAERDLLSRLSGPQRAQVRAVLTLARRSMPYRAVGKVAFLQSLDVARAAAKCLGELLTSAGHLSDPSDVFFLFADEIRAADWGAARHVAERRRSYEEHLGLDLPNVWQGTPTPHRLAPDETSGATSRDSPVIEGIGVSPGIVEGPVRVIDDPALADVEAGEILVAHTTDPSWASIMFLSSALVIDIGGLLSHASVVAREMGVPCVVNTKDATKRLRTGDICRVDGTSGRVEILKRHDPQAF